MHTLCYLWSTSTVLNGFDSKSILVSLNPIRASLRLSGNRTVGINTYVFSQLVTHLHRCWKWVLSFSVLAAVTNDKAMDPRSNRRSQRITKSPIWAELNATWAEKAHWVIPVNKKKPLLSAYATSVTDIFLVAITAPQKISLLANLHKQCCSVQPITFQWKFIHTSDSLSIKWNMWGPGLGSGILSYAKATKQK